MKFFNIIRHFLALTGLVVIITIFSGAYFLFIANNMKSIVLAEKVLKKTGLDSTFVADWVAQKPVRPTDIKMPALNSHDWAGHGARGDRKPDQVHYDRQGFPIPRVWVETGNVMGTISQGQGRTVPVNDAAAFLDAVKKAAPGDVITLSPGTYRLKNRSFYVSRPGTAQLPIVVKAERLR